MDPLINSGINYRANMEFRMVTEELGLPHTTMAQARQRQSAGETEWMEFKTNIGESRCSVTYEGVGNYISGLSNSACLKYRSHGYLVLGVEDGTWDKIVFGEKKLWRRK